MVVIRCQPKISFVDEPVSIQVVNLEKRQRVTLVSRQKNQRGKIFHSWACYEANVEGVVDLQTDKAVKGFYEGVQPMGLFRSMRRIGFSTLIRSNVTVPDIVSISVLDGYHEIGLVLPPLSNFVVLASIEVERHYLDRGVCQIPVKHGNVQGILFLPSHKGEVPGIIEIGGLNGGVTGGRGALIARRGFAVLCLSLFGLPGQPKHLPVIDIEVIERAVHYLQSQDGVARTGVGIIGFSLGGPIVLAACACIPDIRCVVNISGLVFPSNEVDFKFKDQIWKPVSRDTRKVKIVNGIRYSKEVIVAPSLRDMHKHIPDFHMSKASILFQYGGDDNLIKLEENIRLARSMFQSSGKENYEFKVYPGAGHTINVPNTPLVSAMFMSSQHEHPSSMGGRAFDHARAQEDAWKDLIEFLRSHLLPLSSCL